MGEFDFGSTLEPQLIYHVIQIVIKAPSAGEGERAKERVY